MQKSITKKKKKMKFTWGLLELQVFDKSQDQ